MNFTERGLCRPCFIGVVLRMQVERRLDLRVTQDALHGLGFVAIPTAMSPLRRKKEDTKSVAGQQPAGKANSYHGPQELGRKEISRLSIIQSPLRTENR